MPYPEPVPIPFYYAAIIGALLLAAIVGWVCYAVFDVAPIGAGLIGIVFGALDFMIVKFLFNRAKASPDAHDNRIG